MHLAPLIRDLALILGVAGVMSLLFRKLRQPVVLGYLIAGLIVGPYTPLTQLVSDAPNIQTWAELGVIFLMFSLGLEFSFRKLAHVGLAGGLAATTEILFFLPVGFLVAKLFGWSSIDGLFLGAALSISSSTMIIKALDEMKLKTRRFASLIFGVLIVEDLNAILLLVALTTIAKPDQVFSAYELMSAALKLVLVIGGWFMIGFFIIPRFMKHVSRVGNNEVITLLSVGLCLALVVFADHFQYSTALGAFIMGSILAETNVLHRIEAQMAPLRDLFGAIFFVSIGMLIDPRVLWEHKKIVAILVVVVILGKVFSASLGSLLSGQTFKNSLQVGLGLAQIGEFSFIIAGLGMTLNATNPSLYPILVAVSLVTAFVSPYLMRYSEPIALRIESCLPTRIKKFLNDYFFWAEQRMSVRDKKETLSHGFRWFLNGLLVSVFFVLSDEILSEQWNPLLAFGAAAIISSPFIWAMLFAGKNQNTLGVQLFFRIATPIWIGLLSTRFFPGKMVLQVSAGITLLAFGLFYRRLGIFYDWYEKNFLATFEKPEASKPFTERLGHLAPWEMHLVKIEVHPNASIVKKSLLDSELRTRHGVNVVAIQRGANTIVAPHPSELILPGDELIVLGTDQQVDSMKSKIEKPPELEEGLQAVTRYQMRRIQLSENSPFIDHTIRSSGFREKYQAMVVGIERDGKRNPSPDSDLKLLLGDTLWVVGEKNILDKIPL